MQMKYPKLCRESVYFVFFIALDVPENSLAFLPFFFYTIQVNWLINFFGIFILKNGCSYSVSGRNVLQSFLSKNHAERMENAGKLS